jgi:hypothetical protein
MHANGREKRQMHVNPSSRWALSQKCVPRIDAREYGLYTVTQPLEVGRGDQKDLAKGKIDDDHRRAGTKRKSQRGQRREIKR